MIDAVIFDWGGTLSEFVDAELVDAWRLAARHLDPDREDEITARLVPVEADFWATTASHQRSATLADLLADGGRRARARRGRGAAGGGGRPPPRRVDAPHPPRPRRRPDPGRAARARAADRHALEHPLAPDVPRALPRAGRPGRPHRRPALHQRDAVPEAPPLRLPGRARRPRRRARPTPSSWATGPGTTSRAPRRSACAPSCAPTRWRPTSTASSPTPASPPCPSSSAWSQAVARLSRPGWCPCMP